MFKQRQLHKILFLPSDAFSVSHTKRMRSTAVLMLAVLTYCGSVAADQLTGPVNQFTVSLFNELRKEKPQENVFVSPFSVSTALATTLLGSRSQTADELSAGLHFNQLDSANVHQLFQKVCLILFSTVTVS